jgi:hypothetical protein
VKRNVLKLNSLLVWESNLLKTKLCGLSPRANYTDRRSPLVGEVSANVCWYRLPRDHRDASLRSYSRLSRPELLNFLSSSSSVVLTPLWSSGQSSWLQIASSGFDSRRYLIFWEVVVLERGPLSLVSTILSGPRWIKLAGWQNKRNNLPICIHFIQGEHLKIIRRNGFPENPLIRSVCGGGGG